MRSAAKLAIFVSASIVLGCAIALAVPTDLRTAPSFALEDLGQPRITDYAVPAPPPVLTGADSYPVVYSPKHLAQTSAAQRARLARLAQQPAGDEGYDQPSEQRDAALEHGDARAVAMHRGSNAGADGENESVQLNEADAPKD